jgi:ribose transport system substrate-binding protein
MRKYFILGLCLLIIGLAGCQGKDKTPAADQPKPTFVSDRVGTVEDLQVTPAEIAAAKARAGNGLIGLVPCTMANEYHFTAADAAKKSLEAYGLKVQLIDPETKPERQISAVENLTVAGAKVIVICVLDPKVVAAALASAARDGVYVVQYAGADVTANGIGISIDDADLGTAAGQYASQLINTEFAGAAQVAILDYPDLPNAVIRADHIEKAIAAGAPQAKIVGRYVGGTQEKGLTSMESAFQAYPGLNVVVSINDAGAYGAYGAMQAAGKDPAKAAIIGIDAEKRALELIQAGGLYRATVDTQPARTGQMAAQAVVKILNGAALPARIKVPIKVVTRADLQEKK